MIRTFKIDTTDASFFWSLPAVLWQIFFFYIPVFLVLVNSFFQANMANTLTLDNYRYFFNADFFTVMFQDKKPGIDLHH